MNDLWERPCVAMGRKAPPAIRQLYKVVTTTSYLNLYKTNKPNKNNDIHRFQGLLQPHPRPIAALLNTRLVSPSSSPLKPSQQHRGPP
ncbi:protein of unknown function [Pseudomonas sp. JV551A1]|uniref:Uncharacterized protein n=1 Tax=Pseudomonas inefficax TaxID=2078786 RepID=A0AAQ1P7R8_9PSED|nr:protein of unknown function [Pseudomonas sp. JV551A1]SPO60858.1 protein of unknown function [Pseudomonas inefficax]